MLESGNGEKKGEGESSSSCVAAPGVHRSTKKVHWMQRDNSQEPGLFCSYLLFIISFLNLIALSRMSK
jgi:hypothetical protein